MKSYYYSDEDLAYLSRVYAHSQETQWAIVELLLGDLTKARAAIVRLRSMIEETEAEEFAAWKEAHKWR
jgi:hypothetical protein